MSLTGQSPRPKPVKQGKTRLRAAAEGQECTLMIYGVCNYDVETTVGCHIREIGFCGMALKPSDLFMLDGCSACHKILDAKNMWDQHGLTYKAVMLAVMETQTRRMNAGLIILK